MYRVHTVQNGNIGRFADWFWDENIQPTYDMQSKITWGLGFELSTPRENSQSKAVVSIGQLTVNLQSNTWSLFDTLHFPGIIIIIIDLISPLLQMSKGGTIYRFYTKYSLPAQYAG